MLYDVDRAASGCSFAFLCVLVAACATTPEERESSWMEGAEGSRPDSILEGQGSGADGASPTATLGALPRWHVYREDKDLPSDSPWRVGREVAIREGDENDPAKWVHLSLGRHWISGDRYFDDLMEESHITATDLLMIASDILQHHGNLPRLSASMEIMSFEGEGPDESIEIPLTVAPPPRRGPASARRRGAPAPPPTPRQRAAYDAYVAEVENGVRPGDPPPKPFPGGAGYATRPGEHKETFRCEGGVFYGYKHACIDWQRMRDGEKWEKKLVSWSERYFTLKNVALSPYDKEQLCKWGFSAALVAACLSGIAGCTLGEVITVGGATIPCAMLSGWLCAVPDRIVNNILDCHEWAHRRESR